MEDTVAQQLLNQVPKGEEIRDPRVGSYENAVLSEVKLSDDKQAAVLVFTGLVDSEGNSFEYPFRVSLPTRESPDWMKRMFLATLHDVGVLPREDKSARYVESDEIRDAVVELFRQFIGSGYPIRLTESKDGFTNLRFLRRKNQ